MASFTITKEQLFSFHNIDRQVYKKLLFDLHFDPKLAKQIIAFWFLLERKSLKHFISYTLFLSNQDFKQIVKETLICFESLIKNWYSSTGNLCISSMQRFFGVEFTLEEIHARREKFLKNIEEYTANVCDRIFHDIDDERTELLNKKLDTTDRTLFVTFSKGHSLSHEELKELLIWKYGDIIECIHMSMRRNNLYARVVITSDSETSRILNGQETVKLKYKGKDVWLRRYIKKLYGAAIWY